MKPLPRLAHHCGSPSGLQSLRRYHVRKTFLPTYEGANQEVEHCPFLWRKCEDAEHQEPWHLQGKALGVSKGKPHRGCEVRTDVTGPGPRAPPHPFAPYILLQVAIPPRVKADGFGDEPEEEEDGTDDVIVFQLEADPVLRVCGSTAVLGRRRPCCLWR